MNAAIGADGRAASAVVGGIKVVLAWLGICAASCGMAVVAALWAGA